MQRPCVSQPAHEANIPVSQAYTFMHNPCAVIPVYNHESAITTVVDALIACGLPCILVDDASDKPCAAVLDQLALRERVYLIRLAANQGKGGAVMTGLREASRLEFSHALQVDADGQHDLQDVTTFIAQSRAHPQALICGYPQYDASVPKGRLYARYLTHVMVWINTLSLQIRDSMCGFRVYPLPPVLALIDSARIGKRMDFDSDILVRLAWHNQPMRWLPTKVHYPLDGVSHFRLFHDNVLISSMHTRLFFGMLLRAPVILWRRWRA
ncbi:Glycosyl transferase [Pseudomonas sp. IT-P12]